MQPRDEPPYDQELYDHKMEHGVHIGVRRPLRCGMRSDLHG